MALANSVALHDRFRISKEAWDAMPPALQQIWMRKVGYVFIDTVPPEMQGTVEQYFIVQAPHTPSLYMTLNIGTPGTPKYVHAPMTIPVKDLTEVMKSGAAAVLSAHHNGKDTDRQLLEAWTRIAWIRGLRHMDVVLVDPTAKSAADMLKRVNGSNEWGLMPYRPLVLDSNLTDGVFRAMMPSDKNAELPRADYPVLVGDYSKSRWALELARQRNGTSLGHGVRMVGLLGASMGPGSVGYILAEGGAGKTVLMEEYFARFANLTKLPEYSTTGRLPYVVYVSLGERQGDISRAMGALELVDYDPTRIEMFFCGATGRASWLNNLAILAMERAQRIAETGNVDVVVLFDSFSRWERAGSSATSSDKLLTGGIPPEVLDMIRAHSASGAYWEGWGSMTILGTMLSGPDPKTRIANAEGALSFQVADSGSTTTIYMVRGGGAVRPSLNVSRAYTQSRHPELMLTQAQLQEVRAMQIYMWGSRDGVDAEAKGSASSLALKKVKDTAIENPVPPDYPGVYAPYWFTPYLKDMVD